MHVAYCSPSEKIDAMLTAKCGAGESKNLPSPNCVAFHYEIHILHVSGPSSCRDKFKTVLESLWANRNEHIQVEFQI